MTSVDLEKTRHNMAVLQHLEDKIQHRALCCVECGKIFRMRDERICPACGSDEIIDINVCGLCGKRLPDTDGSAKPDVFCGKCHQHIKDEIRRTRQRLQNDFDLDSGAAMDVLRYGVMEAGVVVWR